VTDRKMLHKTALMMIEVVDAPHFIVELWHRVTLTTIMKCSEKCGFN